MHRLLRFDNGVIYAKPAINRKSRIYIAKPTVIRVCTSLQNFVLRNDEQFGLSVKL